MSGIVPARPGLPLMQTPRERLPARIPRRIRGRSRRGFAPSPARGRAFARSRARVAQFFLWPTGALITSVSIGARVYWSHEALAQFALRRSPRVQPAELRNLLNGSHSERQIGLGTSHRAHRSSTGRRAGGARRGAGVGWLVSATRGRVSQVGMPGRVLAALLPLAGPCSSPRRARARRVVAGRAELRARGAAVGWYTPPNEPPHHLMVGQRRAHRRGQYGCAHRGRLRADLRLGPHAGAMPRAPLGDPGVEPHPIRGDDVAHGLAKPPFCLAHLKLPRFCGHPAESDNRARYPSWKSKTDGHSRPNSRPIV